MKSEQTQQLIVLCKEIEAAGSKPSVGLLRAKASFKVGVTEAINAIKQHNAIRSQPPCESIEKREKKATYSELEQRVERLEAAVLSLEERLGRLTTTPVRE